MGYQRMTIGVVEYDKATNGGSVLRREKNYRRCGQSKEKAATDTLLQ